MLPVESPPGTGEALPGYLARIARLVGVTPATVYEHLGLRLAGHTQRYVHLVLPAGQMRHVAEALGQPAFVLAHSLLQDFRGLNLRMLAGPSASGAHRDAQRAQWLFMSGTRYCPRCVDEGRPWLNEWQLPWAYACPRHRALLIGTCRSCGLRPDLVVRHGRAAPTSDLDHCSCGRPWVETGVEPARVTQRQIQWQTSLFRSAAGASGRLWGSTVPGAAHLAAWRAACALSADSPGLVQWARRPYLVPPQSASQTAAAVAKASSVMNARTIAAAADAFGQLVGGRAGWGEAIVWDRIPKSSPLAAVAIEWLRQSGRSYVQLARTRQAALELVAVDLARIPTLASPDRLPAGWAAASRPDPVMRRATLSLATARLAGAGTWSDAGEALGIDGLYASHLVRYTLRCIGPAAAADLTRAAFAYAADLRKSASPAARPSGARLGRFVELRQFERGLT